MRIVAVITGFVTGLGVGFSLVGSGVAEGRGLEEGSSGLDVWVAVSVGFSLEGAGVLDMLRESSSGLAV
jgi:hypothetical protein